MRPVGLIACVLVLGLGCAKARPLPQFSYTASDACANLMIVGANADDSEVIEFEVNRERIALAPGVARALEVSTDGLFVTIRQYDSPHPQSRCADAQHDSSKALVSWRATAGRVSITAGAAARAGEGYPVSVSLTDAVFTAANGRTLKQSAPVVINATVKAAAGS